MRFHRTNLKMSDEIGQPSIFIPDLLKIERKNSSLLRFFRISFSDFGGGVPINTIFLLRKRF